MELLFHVLNHLGETWSILKCWEGAKWHRNVAGAWKRIANGAGCKQGRRGWPRGSSGEMTAHQQRVAGARGFTGGVSGRSPERPLGGKKGGWWKVTEEHIWAPNCMQFCLLVTLESRRMMGRSVHKACCVAVPLPHESCSSLGRGVGKKVEGWVLNLEGWSRGNSGNVWRRWKQVGLGKRIGSLDLVITLIILVL